MRGKSQRKVLILVAAISYLSLISNRITAQVSVSDITDRLVSFGFENIRAYSSGKTLFVSYENSIFREKASALSTILNFLTDCGYDTLNVVTLVKDLPVIVTQTKVLKNAQVDESIRISYQTSAAWKQLRGISPNNSHTNKIDLVVYPQVAIMNILLSQIYELQFNLAPALEISLWRGMQFTGQVIFPIVNDPMYGDKGNIVRAGFITLAQDFRLPGTAFGRIVAGKFNADRYGIDLTLCRYFFHGQCSLSAHTGYTGACQYLNGKWYQDDLKVLTGFLKGGYFHKPYQLQFDLSAGRYLNSDYGIRLDCTRYWKKTAVGFYAMKIEEGYNGGFHFALPLCPKQYKKNRSFQLRTPYYFDWEYNAGTEFYYGQDYETRPNENRVEHFYNPDFMIKNLLK
jgi:hypothetical protein